MAISAISGGVQYLPEPVSCTALVSLGTTLRHYLCHGKPLLLSGKYHPTMQSCRVSIGISSA